MAKILCIEDQQFISRLFSIVLKAAGHDVHSAGDGAAGLQLFRSDPPDLVIMDVKLPDANGLDLMRTMRTENPVPFIVLTNGGTAAEGDYIALALQYGAAAAFLKPFVREDLLAAVQQALTSNKSSKAS